MEEETKQRTEIWLREKRHIGNKLIEANHLLKHLTLDVASRNPELRRECYYLLKQLAQVNEQALATCIDLQNKLNKKELDLFECKQFIKKLRYQLSELIDSQDVSMEGGDVLREQVKGDINCRKYVQQSRVEYLKDFTNESYMPVIEYFESSNCLRFCDSHSDDESIYA
jgi:hypothetical protein